MIYDVDQQYQENLTRAFAAGEQRGYQRGKDAADLHLVDQCVALRVRLDRRDALESVALTALAVVCVVACWGSVVWLVTR